MNPGLNRAYFIGTVAKRITLAAAPAIGLGRRVQITVCIPGGDDVTVEADREAVVDQLVQLEVVWKIAVECRAQPTPDGGCRMIVERVLWASGRNSA